MHDFLDHAASFTLPRAKAESPRRAVTKSDRPIIVYFPEAQVGAMDAASRLSDTDRSKWIRQAVREALLRAGITT